MALASGTVSNISRFIDEIFPEDSMALPVFTGLFCYCESRPEEARKTDRQTETRTDIFAANVSINCTFGHKATQGRSDDL